MAKKQKDTRIQFNLSDFYVEKLKIEDGKLFFGTNTRLEEVCKLLELEPKKIARKLKLDKNENPVIDDDQVAEIAMIKGIEFEKVQDISEENVMSQIDSLVLTKEWDTPSFERQAIVTIMGHVDHGKTTLLDNIRKTKVTAGEAGGITQKIGAYQTTYNKTKITFIDTPGHAAFSEMRAKGASVTDIVVIIVAADDSLMPQTKESIEHAQAAGVPIIVAANKMDSPGANLDKVKTDLAGFGLSLEEWGGDIPVMPITATTGEGVDKLLEVIVTQWELLELKAFDNMNATGVVIETNTDPKRGSLTTVLVTNGTIKRSDNIIIGEYYTKVKAITDENGANLVEAHAGEPVELFGLGESPEVGSRFVVTNNPAEAKAITKTMVEVRKNKNRKVEVVANPNDIFAVLDNKKKQLNYIVKADSFGVLEAITKKIKELSTDDVDVNIISEGIGDFTLADMKLAESSGAKGICFNTKVQSSIRQDVLNKSVEVNEYSIIYKIFDEIEEAAASLKEKVFKETKIGEAKVLQIFEFSKIGTITGSVVTKGKFTNKAIVEVVRNGESIYKGEIESLKIEKDNVKSAANGKEFGLVFKNFHATKVDDQLIAYIIEEVK